LSRVDESLILKPIESVKIIRRHFDIAFTPTLEQFVLEHAVGDRVEAENGRTHDFKRNSTALVDVWRGRLSQKVEDLIQNIAGAEVRIQYGSW